MKFLCQPPRHTREGLIALGGSVIITRDCVEVSVTMAARRAAQDSVSGRVERGKRSTCSLSVVAVVQTPCKDGVFSNSQILWRWWTLIECQVSISGCSLLLASQNLSNLESSLRGERKCQRSGLGRPMYELNVKNRWIRL